MSNAQADAVDGIGRDPGVCFVSTYPEDDAGRGGDGG